MRSDVSRNNVILALKDAIVATFDDGKWRELGYRTNTIDIIEGDGRLLRSLAWRDPDYSGRVFIVLENILGPTMEKLDTIEKFVGLETWLKEENPDLYQDLYGGEGEVVPLEDVEEAGGILDVNELNQHAARIRNGIRKDPAVALGSAKELLETVLKTILGEHGSRTAEDIRSLLKKVQTKLDIDPKAVEEKLEGADTIRRTLSNLGQLVLGVAEVRNLYGTGHGRSKGKELEIAHARLVVNAAVSVATFLLELWLVREEK